MIIGVAHSSRRASPHRPGKRFWFPLPVLLALTGAAASGDLCEPQWSAGVGAPSDFGTVLDIAALNDGASTTHFIATGGIFGVGRWTGAAWTPVGEEQLFVVRALTVFDDGGGPALYAAPETAFLEDGAFKGVVRWDGANWQRVDDGLGTFSAIIEDLTVFDDGTGPALYAGGFLLGGPPVNIARWSGGRWSPLAGATGTLTAANVRTIAVFDDGRGPALYAGGNGLTVNGVPTPLARWDGTDWSAVPGMPQADTTVLTAMTVHDDGRGPALYVGGFSSPSFTFPPVVSRFDGVGWSVVATPFNSSIHALASFDDGSGAGPALHVGGNFFETITASGHQPLSRIARLNGNEWEQLNTGTNNGVFALSPSVDLLDGSAPALHVGGSFGTAGGIASANFAQWRGCGEPVPVIGDLDSDGTVNSSDLLILLGAWGACQDHLNCPADLNADGLVNVSDLLILLANWG